MKINFGILLFFLSCLALASARGDDVKSGPERRVPGHFEVDVLTGEVKGKTKFCYYCKFSMEQTPVGMFIFSRKVDDDLATLIKVIDAVQRKNAKLGSVLVGIGSVTEEDMQKFQDAHKVNTPLAVVSTGKDYLARYNLNKKADVTVVIYELGGGVYANFGFTDTKSAAAKANDIVAATVKALAKTR